MRDKPELGVLGPICVTSGDVIREVSGGRQRRALAALAAAGPDGLTIDALATVVWDDHDRPTDVAPHVRTLISRVRGHFDIEDGQPIGNRPGGYHIDEALVSVDAWRFESLLDTASADPHEEERAAEWALALWRGRPFDDLERAGLLAVVSSRLEERRLEAEEARLERWLEQSKPSKVVARAGELRSEHPHRERLVRAEVLALYRSERQADALKSLQDHRQGLLTDLGLDPSPALQHLEVQILDHDPSLGEIDSQSRRLRGYQLADEIGQGAFAIVHRATQTDLEREVAIKVIRPEFADRPEFIRQFESEAHLIARLEHPFIVPLYDFWREPARACLVLRYLRGGSLEQRVSSGGGLPVAACRRMVTQVSSALRAAHHAGIVHRDVKPANILLDDEQNFYLSDFGIALDTMDLSGPRSVLSAGSPAYAAPEQLRKEAVGPAADVHGLALSLFEALSGRLPFADTRDHADLVRKQLTSPLPAVRTWRPELPEAIDDVLTNATTKDPADRTASVELFAEEVERALTVSPDATTMRSPLAAEVRRGATNALPAEMVANPYLGLRSFTEAEAGSFHGRERLVDRLVSLLRSTGTASRILTLVGPSGIGKSSALRAGLLPALRKGAVPSSDQWFTASMQPGPDPFESLAAALRSVATDATAWELNCLAEKDKYSIAKAVGPLMGDDDEAALLLVVDQFEELFTLPTDALVTERFLAALEHAVTEPGSRLRVVLALRADFWDRPLRHPQFSKLIEPSTVHVAALAPDELEQAIVEPARQLGRHFEPGLVAIIAADVADEVGSLPLLQYALAELWERQEAETLTAQAYRDLGGVAGALAARAEALYQESPEQDQAALRRIFNRLVAPGEGSADTKRRALRSELGPEGDVRDVLERLGSARLLSFGHDADSRAATVEISHEALIGSWPRLGRWLEEDRVANRVMREVSDAADRWESENRDDGALYRGARLIAVEELVKDHRHNLTSNEATFVDNSLSAREAAEQSDRRQISRLRRSLVGVGALTLVAMLAGGAAFLQNRRANESAFQSDTLVLVSAARANAQTSPDLALQLALTAIDRQDDSRTRTALLGALNAEARFSRVFGPPLAECAVTTSAAAPASHLALASEPTSEGIRSLSTVSLVDGSSSAIREVLDFFDCVQPNPAADRLLALGQDGLHLISLADPDQDAALTLSVTATAWAPDGSAVVSVGRDEKAWQIRVHDPVDLTVRSALDLDIDGADTIRVSQDLGRALLIGDHGHPTVVDLSSGELRSLETGGSGPFGQLSLDGSIAITFGFGQVHGWDATTGALLWEATQLRGSDGFGHVAINGTGTIAAISTAQGVELISTSSGMSAGPIIQVQGLVHFTTEDELIITSPGEPIRAFSLAAEGLATPVIALGPRGGVISADGSVALTIRDDAGVIIDVASGEVAATLDDRTTHARPVGAGQVIGWDSAARSMVVWEQGQERLRSDLSATVPENLQNMRTPRAGFGRALFQLYDRHDSSMSSNRLVLVDIESGDMLASIGAPEVLLSELFAPDSIFISPFHGPAQLIDLDGNVTIQFPAFATNVSSASMAPDGHIVLGLGDGTVLRWSTDSGEVVTELPGPGSEAMRIEPTDSGVFVQYISGEILWWEWGSQEPITQLVAPGTFVGFMTLSTDGSALYVPREGQIVAIPVSPDGWITAACERLDVPIDEARWVAATGLEPPSSLPC